MQSRKPNCRFNSDCAKCAGFIRASDQFDWLAIVLLPGEDQAGRRIFLVPRNVADARAKQDKPTSKTKTERYWRQDKVAEVLSEFEGNFGLSLTGKTTTA
jgi:hypothetical protein